MTNFPDNVTIQGNLTVSAGNPPEVGPGMGNFFIPAGIAEDRAVYLISRGSGSGDLPALRWRNSVGSTKLEIWTDMANASSRVKSLGELTFHTGNIGFDTTNQRMTITAGGNVGIGNTAPSGGKLQVFDGSSLGGFAAVRVDHNGASSGTNYAVAATKSGASAINVAGFFDAYGGTANYGLIVKNGDVGIGIETPGHALHVFRSGSPVARVESTQDGSPGFQLRSNAPGGVVTTGKMELQGAGANRMVVGVDAGRALDFQTDNLSRLTILGSSSGPTAGNVGIGVPGPIAALHVGRPGNPVVRCESQDQHNPAYHLVSSPQGAGTTYVGSWEIQGGTRMVLGYSAGGLLELQTNNTTRMTINGVGDVGIGLSPSAKLHVAGEIWSTLPIRAIGSGVNGKIYVKGINLDGVADIVDLAGNFLVPNGRVLKVGTRTIADENGSFYAP